MEKLNIPKQIHVGYRERQGTYTGKLAYVIYTDEKGKMRKATSWNGWRDDKIEPNDFDNVPTSGFVLNKGVGGARESWGWNARNEYIRVYDPRDFEFEISVANLLFILQECNSYKGKGLEGEFVYSWDGTELVLLPVDCYEYKKSTEFTAAKSMKVTKKDMVDGCVYMHKNMHEMIYLGRHHTRELPTYDWDQTLRTTLRQDPPKPHHIFYDIEEKEFVFERGFTKLAKRVTQEPHDEYANLYTEFVSGGYVSKLDKIQLKEISRGTLLSNSNGNRFFVQLDKQRYKLFVLDKFNRYHNRAGTSDIVITEQTLHSDCSFDMGLRHHSYHGDDKLWITEEWLTELYPDAKIFTLEYLLQSGKTLEVYDYVK